MKREYFTVGSVCSGIEAASVAAWKAEIPFHSAWFSEIEAAPCRILAERWPDVVNVGDMTRIPDAIRWGEMDAPDLLVGGTPCQAFSISGARESLDDHRGNLTLVFADILDAIDEQRKNMHLPPAVAFWENVEGVFSTHDNAFGCFIAYLAGFDEPLDAPKKGWASGGIAVGPRRRVAWGVRNARDFGLAQRRGRVFVVASADPDFFPDSVFPPDRIADPVPLRSVLQHPADVPASLYLSEKAQAYMSRTRGADGKPRWEYFTNPLDGQASCLTANMYKGVPYGVIRELNRRLTVTECERLQGFPDGYTAAPGVSDSARYKALGNSWAVPVVVEFFKNIYKEWTK